MTQTISGRKCSCQSIMRPSIFEPQLTKTELLPNIFPRDFFMFHHSLMFLIRKESGWFNQNNDSSVQQPSLEERRWSAPQYGCLLEEPVRDLIQVTGIRRVDGNIVTAGSHSSLPSTTGVHWRKTATRSINVVIVCNWQ